MSHVPERITIKRRRDEEPVETLYIENKRIKSTELWKRLQPSAAAPSSEPLSSLDYDDVVQDVFPTGGILTKNRPTPHVKRIWEPVRALAKSSETCVGSHALAGNSVKPKPPGSSRKSPASQPVAYRRFHLAPVLATHESRLSFGNSINKRRRLRKPGTSVFVETRIRTENRSAKKFDIREPASQEFSRTCKLSGSTESLASLDDIKLAAELQQYASRETQTSTNPDNKKKSLPLLKIEPSLLRPQHWAIEEDFVDSVHHTAHGDYVYDTFMQFKAQSDDEARNGQSLHLHGLLRGLPPESVGVLVVAEEDQSTWENFTEDADEEDYDSEEEDENAEDYYGNDYPEEETENDDDFDRSGYYRRDSTPEDEVTDDDAPYWTDDDPNGQSP